MSSRRVPRGPQTERFHVFVNYRRDQTSAHAGRLYDSLTNGVDDQSRFDEDQIFMDIDAILPGDDFRDAIAEAVAKSHVLLALIGRQWANAVDANGRRRLDNPADYVRLEIEAAFEQGVPVVPVLVDGASMPTVSELPESISDLAYRNAFELSDRGWRQDVRELLVSLHKRESRNRFDAFAYPPFQWLPQEIKQLYADWTEAHHEGEILAGRVRGHVFDHAPVELGDNIAGYLPGRFLEPDEPGPDSGGIRWVTADGRPVAFDQWVRVKIERIAPNSEVLTGWDIELSLIEALEDVPEELTH